MLQWAWPSDRVTEQSTLPSLTPPRRKRRCEPKPFAGLTRKPHCDACEPVDAPSPTRPFHPATTHRHDARAPACGRYHHPFLSEPGLPVPGLGRLGQSPRERSSQWGALAAMAVHRLSWLLSGDLRHDLPRQACGTRADGAGDRLFGRRLGDPRPARVVEVDPNRHCQVVETDAITGQQRTHFGLDAHRPDTQAARFDPVMSAQLSKRFFISWRYAAPDNRCRLGRKCWVIGP
jgi:hypothetical protein